MKLSDFCFVIGQLNSLVIFITKIAIIYQENITYFTSKKTTSKKCTSRVKNERILRLDGTVTGIPENLRARGIVFN